MQIHQLKPKNKTKSRKRIGRGGKKGTYSGKGMKGQRSRAGRKMAPMVRELIKRYPKLKGYRAKNINDRPVILTLDVLEKNFDSSEKITPQTLLEKNLIRKIKGRIPKVKILDGGEIKKKLNIENCQASKSVKESIKKAGGEIK